MATESVSCTALIGAVAGDVWHALEQGGPMTLTQLVKTVGSQRDTVMQAVGWLAREGKIELAEAKRKRIIRLR